MHDQHPPGEPPYTPPVSPGHEHAAGPVDRNGVLVPMLISGIFNIIYAIGWAWTCFGIPLSVALLILAIYEFTTYLDGQRMSREHIVGRSGTLGVLEICTILTGNVASFVCGIIVVVNRGRL